MRVGTFRAERERSIAMLCHPADKIVRSVIMKLSWRSHTKRITQDWMLQPVSTLFIPEDTSPILSTPPAFSQFQTLAY